MSEKLRPEDLTSAVVREVFPPPPPLAGWLGFYFDSDEEDGGWFCSGKVHPDREEALCELAEFRPFEGSALVEVGQTSALFSPAPSESAKVECPNCGKLTNESHSRYAGPGPDKWTCEPAPPEPAVIRQSTTDAGEPPQSETRTAGNAQPEPAAPEMPVGGAPDGTPYEIAEAVAKLVRHGEKQEAHNLAGWWMRWRTHAQPVAVGMTEELERLLVICETKAEDDDDNECPTSAKFIRADIAAVRQQAAQPVRLEKVRAGIDFLISKCDPRCNMNVRHYEAMLREMIAELDAYEGKGEGRG